MKDSKRVPCSWRCLPCVASALALTLGLMVTPAAATVTINEIRIDQPGSDTDEYFELAGTASESLAGLTYLVIGDGAPANSSGVIEAVIDLTGNSIPADGFFLVAEDADTFGAVADLQTALNFENSDNVTHLLVSGFSGANGDDLDLDDDGTLDVTPWTSELDRIALVEEPNPPTGTEYHYGPPSIGPDGPFVPGHVYRDPDATGSWNIGPFDPAVGQDTPGVSNSLLPVVAVGKLTTMQVNATNVSISLCATGGQGSLTLVITNLTTNGTLKDGGSTFTVPHDLVGPLTYTPNGGYSGLDTFTFHARDEAAQVSDEVTQELAVQQNTVVITEVMHSPSGDDRIYEYIEIYNNSGSAVALTRLDATRDPDFNKTTVGNLSVSIPANTMKIIAPSGQTPTSDEEFRCEWGLREIDIIRIPIASFETMFSSPAANCWQSAGSRILLFGAGDVLLDAVDMGLNATTDCDNSSAVFDPFAGTPNTQNNDDMNNNWGCSDVIPDGRITGLSGDLGSPGWVPNLHTNPTYESCLGACCLGDQSCVDGVTQDECLNTLCGSQFFLGDTCAQVTCPVVDFGKCCLPFGQCLDTFETDCLCAGGNFNGATTCVQNPDCPVTVALIINELEYDEAGTDTAEFIELYSVTPGAPTAGWTLEFFNGNDMTGDNIYRTVDLSTVPGGVIPGDGFLVIGSANVPNVDLVEWTSGGIQNGDPNGDGVVLLFSGVVVEALSYETGTNGFTAVGGQADGTFMPDIGLSDATTRTLQKIPDAGTWTETFNNTPGESNFDAGDFGACCDLATETCTLSLPEDCTSVGLEFQGLGTDCDPNPCIPAGACCLPDGSCLDNIYENTCLNILGGSWNGDGTICPDDQAFTDCLDGPVNPVPTGCDQWDLDTNGHVDLADYALYQQDTCMPDPVGACCPPDGICVEISQFECASIGGDYRGDGVQCAGLDPPCEPPVPGAILINEVWADDPGGDDHEFIELFGAPSTSLAGLSLIIVDGDTGGDTASVNYRAVNFQADFTAGHQLDANGFFVMGTGPNLAGLIDVDLDAVFGDNDGVVDEIQNGSQTYALVLTSDIEFCTSNGVPPGCNGNPNELTPQSVADITSNAIDTVATRFGLFDHVYFFAPLVQDSGTFPFDYAQRIPNGTDTNSPGDWETVFGNELGDPADPSTPDDVNQSQSAIPGACCINVECRELFDTDCATSNGVFLGFGSTCTPNPCVCESVADAEVKADGTPVCITGAIITRDWDNIGSTSWANFYIQDAVGTNGIAVFGGEADIAALLNNSGAAMGDEIEVRGELTTYYTTRELQAPQGGSLTLTVLSSPGVPAPFVQTIGGLPSPASEFDPIMSTLIKLENVEFDPADQGNTFQAFQSYPIHHVGSPTVTMDLRIQNSNNPPPIVGTTIPSGAVDIVGIAEAFAGNYQIHVFFPSSITPH